jgi:hypothetical protein
MWLPNGVEFDMSVYRSLISKPRTMIASLAVVALIPALAGSGVAASDSPSDEAALQPTRGARPVTASKPASTPCWAG